MKKSMLLLSMGMLAMVAGADTVNFTTAEGYTTPGALTDYAGWSGGTTFTVNTNGTGTVDWDGSVASAEMNYETGVAATAPTIELSMQFRMTRVAGWRNGIKTITALFLETDAVGDDSIADGLNDTRVTIERVTAEAYRIAFNNTTMGIGKINGAYFNQSLLGIAAVDDVSGLLELSMVLHRGATAADWTSDTVLKNLTTDTVVSQILGEAFTSSAAYFDSTLYGAFSSSNVDDGLGLSDRQIESFTVIPEPETLGMMGIASAGILFIRRILSA